MRIFILGAGYIGAELLQIWSNKNDTFWVSTTSSEKLKSLSDISDKAFLLKGNDINQLRKLLEACDALIIPIAPNAGISYEETYLKTAETILKALESREKPFYLLYTSSTSVYGDHQGSIVDEQSNRLAQSENGKILCKTEDTYLSCSNKNIKICILRLAGIFGPGREIEKRAAAYSGRSIPGNGDSATNHIHRNDITGAIEFCVLNQCTGVFNLSNEDHRSRKAIYESICKELKIPYPIWDSKITSEHGSNCLVSNKKILSHGFHLKYPLINVQLLPTNF